MHGKLFGLPFCAWTLILSLAAFFVDFCEWASWASFVFGKAKLKVRPGLVPPWRRPSTILIVLTLTVLTFGFTDLTWMAIVLFFGLRFWEHDAFANKNLKRSDIEAAHDPVLGADPKPRQKHWYNDVNH